MNYNVNTHEGMANAKQWTRMCIGGLVEGGTWYIPMCDTELRVWKERYEIHASGGPLDPTVQRVLEAMGYRVIAEHSEA